MKHLLLFIFALNVLIFCEGQSRNVTGIFREIDMENRSATYIELKSDSTLKIKRVSFKDSTLNKKFLSGYGRWKLTKDTVVLNFESTPENNFLNNSGENQLQLLIKNKNILYSHKTENRKFIKDGLLWKAKKFVRLPQQFTNEYYKLQD